MQNDRSDVPKESRFLDVSAEQLRHLVNHDDQSYACFETRQHGIRNEIGDEPKPKQ